METRYGHKLEAMGEQLQLKTDEAQRHKEMLANTQELLQRQQQQMMTQLQQKEDELHSVYNQKQQLQVLCACAHIVCTCACVNTFTLDYSSMSILSNTMIDSFLAWQDARNHAHLDNPCPKGLHVNRRMKLLCRTGWHGMLVKLALHPEQSTLH